MLAGSDYLAESELFDMCQLCSRPKLFSMLALISQKYTDSLLPYVYLLSLTLFDAASLEFKVHRSQGKQRLHS